MPCHVSKKEFERLVAAAIAELPPQFREFIENVPVHVEWQPSLRLLREVGLEDDELLFGLYQGPSLMDKSEVEGRGTPMLNQILIFQEDHELMCDTKEDLVAEIRTTVMHELGHHFGMSEEDLDELGYG